MKNDNITSPEEKLLRLIRSGHKKALKTEGKTTKDFKANRAKETTKQPFSAEKTMPKKFSLPVFLYFTKIITRLSFVRTIRILMVGFLLLLIYLVFDFMLNSPAKIEGRVLALDRVATSTLEIPQKIKAVPLKPVSFYTKSVKSRDIFTAVSSDSGPQRPTPTFMEMIANFRLQGIITGPNPQAIIEDTKTQKIYFLSPGEFVGEIELKQILAGKVVLSYHGQEADLGL